MDYITVRGFKMCHAATQWAPPTSEQTGLIGPNWSKGWIIENNLIMDSKGAAISLTKQEDGFYLRITIDKSFKTVKTKIVDTGVLGVDFQSETPFEKRDATPITLDTDYLGNKRKLSYSMVGPFDTLIIGVNTIKVADMK